MRSRNERYRIKIKVLIFIVLIFIPITMMCYIISDLSSVDLTRYDTLRTTQQDINIFTPENKTYTKPMNSYYPGTHGFENDKVGDVPYNWIDSSGDNCYVKVNDSLAGHTHVLDCYDNSNSNISSIETTFSNQSYGTIEFWVRTDDATSYTDIDFLLNGTQVFTLIIENDQFNHYNGSAMNYIANATDNLWYHIRIDFECTTGSWGGLSQYQYKVYINDVDYGVINFWRNRANINKILIKTHYGNSGYHSYFDAFGFSWDYFYHIGDNAKEGLLLSFDNNTSYDWISYSFDQTTKRVIFGNITIAFPENGVHTIQIIGEDAGTMIVSDIRHFTVNINSYIKIINPQNQTYYNPMHGYYPATFGFENDDSGKSPANWTESTGSNCSVQVIDSFDCHNSVIDCYDNSGSNIYSIKETFDPQFNGSIEFWVSTNDTTYYTNVDFTQSGSPQFNFIIEKEKFRFYNGAWVSFEDAYDNIWYHVRIDFECTTGGYMGLSQYQYKIYINGIDYGVIGYWYNGTHIDGIVLKSHFGNIGYHSYFDAFGYSWDPNYNVGDNKNEGLLLSFKTDIAFDWLEYSLNGNMNRTILGNVTLVFPVDGVYRIQVFGVDWQGSKVYSTIRYFTININPMIEIKTPKNQTYFGPMNSYYPATFGFENDNNGDFPSHWIDTSGVNCTVKVIDFLGGHNHVIDCYDNSGTNIYYITNEFKARQNGTIEFWIRTTNSALYTDIDFRKASITLFNIIIDEGKFRYYDGSWHDIENANDNIWYRIRIDFDCTTGGYEGLSQYQSRVFINNINYGTLDFWHDDIYIDEILIKSRHGDTSYHSYFDAFGYSWDPNYNLGDNWKEGLNLGFNSNIGLEWVSYSLDGMSNKPILGNTTIVMPEDGLHTIQVVGIDMQGITFYSNLIYFSVSQYPIIIINSPSQFEVYGKNTPSFNITILGQSLDTFWYTLDAGITNLTFNELTGNIDQDEWKKKENGMVTITFYVNNTQGFVTVAELIVIKCISGKTSRAIPGFNLFLIISLFSIISMKIITNVLMRKPRNDLN
ncbi:MAG: hypothetical protein ACFFG0_23435 [Candidatus Thorarchaeota archaeon]